MELNRKYETGVIVVMNKTVSLNDRWIGMIIEVLHVP